jgi:hypothetical protein
MGNMLQLAESFLHALLLVLSVEFKDGCFVVWEITSASRTVSTPIHGSDLSYVFTCSDKIIFFKKKSKFVSTVMHTLMLQVAKKHLNLWVQGSK